MYEHGIVWEDEVFSIPAALTVHVLQIFPNLAA